MQIKVINNEILADGVIRLQAEIPTADFLYVGYLLESFEGICLYTTPDKSQNIMQIDVMPEFLAEFNELLAALQNF